MPYGLASSYPFSNQTNRKPPSFSPPSLLSFLSSFSSLCVTAPACPHLPKTKNVPKKKKSPHEEKKTRILTPSFFSAAFVQILYLETWIESLASKIHTYQNTLSVFPTRTSLSVFIPYSPQHANGNLTPFFKNVHGSQRWSGIFWKYPLAFFRCMWLRESQ